VTPDAGRVTVSGYDVQRDLRAVRQLLVPVLAYERTLNGRLSARENLRIFAALYRLHGQEARRRIEDVLGVVGLADTGEKIVDTFSSGMRQRLTIARALLARPAVLLLDEPTRSLDPVSAKSFRQFLRDEVAGRQGCTVLLATHSTEEAFGLCDRVGILHKGRLLAQGTSAALVRAYGDDGYRAWVRPPDGSDVAALARSLGADDPRVVGTDDDGWRDVRFTLPGGRARGAAVLEGLLRSGAAVSHFEQSALSLADLIERVVLSEGRSR
jgi:ABC-type multidrug transport system ATPase subunit